MNTYIDSQPAATNSASCCSVRPAGRKGAIARLIVMALIAVIGVLSSVGTLPNYIVRRGFVSAILEAIGGCGTILLLAAWCWGMMKWIAVVAPKAFRAAGSFWCAWEPLTFFGLYIKGCLWLLIGLVPTMIFGYTFVPLFLVTQHFAENGIGFFSALLLFAAGIAVVALLAFWDICKLRDVSPVATLREKLTREKD